MAQRGYDLAIVARRMERLRAVAAELESTHGVGVTCLEHDLADPAAAARIVEAIAAEGRPPHVLINNAGLGAYGYFDEQTWDDLQAMIDVNLRAATELTHRLAGVMREAGGGYILNNSSFSAIQHAPGYAVYSATKAYVLALSIALRHELKRHNVWVSAVCPGFFASDFFAESGQRRSLWVRAFMLESPYVARVAVRGLFRRRSVIVPGAFYRGAALAARFTPSFLQSAIADRFIRVD